MWEDKKREESVGRGREREWFLNPVQGGEPPRGQATAEKKRVWVGAGSSRSRDGRRQREQALYITGCAFLRMLSSKLWRSQEEQSVFITGWVTCHHPQGRSRKKLWAPFTSLFWHWLLSESVKVGGEEKRRIHAAFPDFLPSRSPRNRERRRLIQNHAQIYDYITWDRVLCT